MGILIKGMRMKKSLIIIPVVALALLIAFYALGAAVLGKVAKAGVQAFVPQMTGTPLVMDNISVSPISGAGSVEGFILGNPDGYKSDYSIAFGRAHLDIAPFSILGDRILIEKVHITAPKFNYERKLLSSNINEILKNVQAAAGRVEGEQPAEDPAKESTLKIEIKELIIEEGQVSLSMAGATVPLPLPRIVLRDIGTAEGGIPPDQMAFEVISVVLRQVLEAAAKSPGGAVQGIKNIFGGGE